MVNSSTLYFPSLLLRKACRTVWKAFLKSRSSKSTASFLPPGPIALPKKNEMDLFLINPCSTLLSLYNVQSVHKLIIYCSIVGFSGNTIIFLGMCNLLIRLPFLQTGIIADILSLWYLPWYSTFSLKYMLIVQWLLLVSWLSVARCVCLPVPVNKVFAFDDYMVCYTLLEERCPHHKLRSETSKELKEYSDKRNTLCFPVLTYGSLEEYWTYLLSQYKETCSCNNGVERGFLFQWFSSNFGYVKANANKYEAEFLGVCMTTGS